MQAVHDKVMENSALLKELWEGRRQQKELPLALHRQKEHTTAMQQEYDHFRHQVSPLVPAGLWAGWFCRYHAETKGSRCAQRKHKC